MDSYSVYQDPVFQGPRPCGRPTKRGSICDRTAPRFYAACFQHITPLEAKLADWAESAEADGFEQAKRAFYAMAGLPDPYARSTPMEPWEEHNQAELQEKLKSDPAFEPPGAIRTVDPA